MMDDEATKLFGRIENYLASGGLFNPESMDPEKVRDLLIDIRNYLSAPPDESHKRTIQPWGIQ